MVWNEVDDKPTMGMKSNDDGIRVSNAEEKSMADAEMLGLNDNPTGKGSSVPGVVWAPAPAV